MKTIIISSCIGILLIIFSLIIYFVFRLKNNKKINNKNEYVNNKIFFKKNKIINFKKFNISESGIVLSSGIKKLSKINNNFVIKNLNKKQNHQIDKQKWSVVLSNKRSSIVISPPGTGKTQALLLPTIYYNIYCKDKPCMIVTDPKPEILEALNIDLIKNNYEIINLSLIERPKDKNSYFTDYWNPMDIIIDLHKKLMQTSNKLEIQNLESNLLNEINKLVDVLAKGNNDKQAIDYWKINAIQVISFYIIIMLWNVELNELNYDQINLKNLTVNVNSISDTKLLDLANAIKTDLNNLDQFKTLTLAKNYLSFSNERPDNIKSFITGASTILSTFNKTYFSLLTSKSSFDLDQLIQNNIPFIIFININTSSTATNSEQVLLKIYLDLINQKIDYWKKNNLDFKNKTVWWFLDEAGNIPKIDFLENIIAFGRGYNIFALPIFQTWSQIKEIYNEGLIDACEYRIIFNNSSDHLGKRISLLSGQTKCNDKQNIKQNLAIDDITDIPNGFMGVWTAKKRVYEKVFYKLPITYFYMIKSKLINGSNLIKFNKAYLLANHQQNINIDNNIEKLANNKSYDIDNNNSLDNQHNIKEAIINKIRPKQKLKSWQFFNLNINKYVNVFSKDELILIKNKLSLLWVLLKKLYFIKKLSHEFNLVKTILNLNDDINNIFNRYDIKYENDFINELNKAIETDINPYFQDERLIEHDF